MSLRECVICGAQTRMSAKEHVATQHPELEMAIQRSRILDGPGEGYVDLQKLRAEVHKLVKEG